MERFHYWLPMGEEEIKRLRDPYKKTNYKMQSEAGKKNRLKPWKQVREGFIYARDAHLMLVKKDDPEIDRR